MRRPSIVLVIFLMSGACDDDGGGAASRPEDSPWDLTEIDMPDMEDEIEALFAALPDQIEGRSQSDVL